MGKIKIEKFDFLRVMLTDVLPYEVPINFLNEGFYFYLKQRTKERSNDNERVLDKLFECNKPTIPYNYRINKNSSSKRLLSICHPSIQLEICNLYKSYDSLMIELCGRSRISLRAPCKVADRYYEKDLAEDFQPSRIESIDIEKNGFDKVSPYASSYFTYKKYNFLYKYYDSYESHRIEKKFCLLTKFDISKCFHNIYTESIKWAVKEKNFSKAHSNSYSFENQFCSIMNKSNYNESSGIIVGPEFSRIFSEIILQKIDQSIIYDVETKLSYVFDKDYTIKRYVDDYFLYTKNKSSSESIQKVIKEKLEEYKMFINESKTGFMQVPFITGLTISKTKAKEVISETFSKILTRDIDNNLSVVSFNPSRLSNKLIKDIKILVKDNDIQYESISGYILSDIKRRVEKFILDENVFNAVKNNYNQNILNFLLFSLEVSFFIYCMDVRVRTTYIITQLVVLLNKFTDSSEENFKDVVRKKIFDESSLLLSKLIDEDKKNTIEAYNLLISICTNFQEYKIQEHHVLPLFDIGVKGNEYYFLQDNCIDYFQAMVLIYIYRDRCNYLTRFIQRSLLDRFCTGKNYVENTELVCIFLDSMSCPYFDIEFKKQLASKFFRSIPEEICVVGFVDFVSKFEWFFSWKPNNLYQILMKKELRSPY